MIKAIDKEKVAQAFLRGKDTYDSHARIQRLVSARLVEKLHVYRQMSFGRVLEIGCCTGMLTEMLLRFFPVNRLYLNDLVPDFYTDVVNRLGDHGGVELSPLFGDIETLDLPHSLDLVISSATFQWLADLERFFAKVAASLSESGYLAFSIFGPGTLSEFKQVSGIGLEYTAVGAILELLEVHFQIEEEETHKDQLYFVTPRDVLRHMQATGVGGVRRHRWTPGALRDFENRYLEQFGTASGVPVSYFSSCIIASRKK